MSEINNQLEFLKTAKFVDFDGLDYFWKKAKNYIDTSDSGLTSSISTTNENVSKNATDISDLKGKVSDLEGAKVVKDVKYDNDSKFIYLLDANGEVIGNGFDASEFVVDGMLDGVEFETVTDAEGNTSKTNNLVFTFNTSAGKESIPVDFSKYVDTYSADESSLTLDSTTNKFSIKNVSAEKTTLSGDIQVAGGPLANDIAETNETWPSDWYKDGVKIIPQGKSMEEILTALFLKVVDGTVTWGTASWTPTISNPTVTLSSSGTVEVGSTVKVTKLNAGAVNAKSRSVTCTCTEGHFLTDEVDADGKPVGTWQSGNKTISIDGSIDGSASLACTWNNVEAEITVNDTELDVVEGTNTLVVSQSGQTAKCEALPTTKVWASTNTKKLLSDVSAEFSESAPDDKPLTSSNNATCTGKYKYFLGYSDNTLYSQFVSSSVRALTTKSDWITVGGTTTIVGDTAIKSNGKSIVIACPKTYNLATITNGVGANILDNFTTKGSQGEVDVTTGSITTKYNVYVYPITNGAEVEFKNVTLTKA
jgi:hypothetical protein